MYELANSAIDGAKRDAMRLLPVPKITTMAVSVML